MKLEEVLKEHNAILRRPWGKLTIKKHRFTGKLLMTRRIQFLFLVQDSYIEPSETVEELSEHITERFRHDPSIAEEIIKLLSSNAWKIWKKKK